jgi:DNA-binding response OmpR family regulator
VSVVIWQAGHGHIVVQPRGLNGIGQRPRRDAEGPLASRNLVSLQGYIVIVEPDDLIRELVERWLGEAGYGVVQSAKNHDKTMVIPQLVIADISDPGSAGATIEALQAAYSAPILALSARFRRGLGGSSEAAHRLHVVKVLPKPFTREELLAAVREAVGES